MFIPAGVMQALKDENAEMWVVCRHHKAFAEKSAFWVVYSDPVERKRLGSGVTKKAAWLAAYRTVEPLGD